MREGVKCGASQIFGINVPMMEGVIPQNWRPHIMQYTPVGVDIAKHLMQVHYVDSHSGELVDKKVRRNAFLTFFRNRELCLIGMEACGGSQF